MILVHYPQCTSFVIHSGAKGTVVSRGVDQPEALSPAASFSGARHALFWDFKVEGVALVLQARLLVLTLTYLSFMRKRCLHRYPPLALLRVEPASKVGWRLARSTSI
ncbi:hypothetical protein [Pajaroellobacter abortibovis]|nr:hypothetical protein [Pajaroellobacter abortibovis]